MRTKTVNLIRVKRRAAGMNASELAAILGTSRQLVSAWETGAAWPGNRFVPKLAAVFGQSAESLARELEEARLSESASVSSA